MFISLFFCSISSSRNFAIDFGSYYTKSGNLSEKGHPIIAVNYQSKRLTHTFLAFRTSSTYDKSYKVLLESDIMQFKHEIGESAYDLMSSKPWLGSGYFPRFVDANYNHSKDISSKLFIEDPFSVSKFGQFNMTAAFLHFYTENVLGYIPNILTVTKIVVPFSNTVPQNLEISNAAKKAGLVRVSTISDAEAIISYYASEKTELYQKKPMTILFIDVGATSVKAYSILFDLMPNKRTAAKILSYYRDDLIGGAYATSLLTDFLIKKKLNLNESTQKEKLVIFKYAEKLKYQLTLLPTASIIIDIKGKTMNVTVERSEFEHLISDFIMGTVNVALRAAGRLEIDKVEIIGGSSRIPKIQRALEKEFTTLGHTLNADEVLTLGALASFDDSSKINVALQLVPSVAALFQDNAIMICSSSYPFHCYPNIYFKSYPNNVSLKYTDTKEFETLNVRTQAWNYTWRKSESKDATYSAYINFDPQITQIEETSGAKRTNMTGLKHIAPDFYNTTFVEILKKEHSAQKSAAELINRAEELYFRVVEVSNEITNFIDDANKIDFDSLLANIKENLINAKNPPPQNIVEDLYKRLTPYYQTYEFSQRTSEAIILYQSHLDALADFTNSLPKSNPRIPDYQKYHSQMNQKLQQINETLKQKNKNIKEVKKEIDLQAIQASANAIEKYILAIKAKEKVEYKDLSIYNKLRVNVFKFLNSLDWYFSIFDRILFFI